MSKSDYRVLNEIGKGSFGRVSKIERICDKQIFVWKEINYGKMKDDELNLLINEVNILKKLKNPFIVSCNDRIIDKKNEKIYIIMEYCEGGDLSMYISNKIKNKEKISEEKVWNFLSQICIALLAIHKRIEGKIIHRDIKPGNIFLSSDRSVKLGDFGLAKILEFSNNAHTSVGTPYYMSPELISTDSYNEKVDIWSLGCVLYELCTFNPPFCDETKVGLYKKIIEGKYPPITSSSYSNSLKNIIDGCLRTNPEKRFSIDDLAKIPQISLKIEKFNFKNEKILFEIQVKKKEELLKKREKILLEREKKILEKQKEIQIYKKQGKDKEKIAILNVLEENDFTNKENIKNYENFKKFNLR